MINCVIVDDEPLALDLLADFIRRTDTLKLLRRFDNALEAVKYLNRTKTDLLFLDIHMPDISGLELLKLIENNVKIVFTTAYPEHAVKGFELNAIDYLLKPFSFERFLQTVGKIRKEFEKEEDPETVITIKSGYENVRIPVNEILYAVALKDYIQIYTPSKKILSLLTMGSLLQLLPEGEFIRVHRSYIVPLNKITKFTSRHIYISDTRIPIGESYRDQFLAVMQHISQKK